MKIGETKWVLVATDEDGKEHKFEDLFQKKLLHDFYQFHGDEGFRIILYKIEDGVVVKEKVIKKSFR